MRWLGILLFVFYAIHGGVHVSRGDPHHLLWACHVAALLAGLGLVLRDPTLNAIGFLWSCMGIPLWLIDLATGGEFIVTSPLTHLGTFALGLYGVRRLGMPRLAALKALGAFVPLWAVCRLLTPPAANVNLAFRVHDGWEAYFPSYALYFLLLLVVAGIVFATAERAAA